jgi:hypothetical protein
LSSGQDKIEKAKIYLDLAIRTDQTIQQAYQRLTEKIKSAFTLASALIPIVAGLGYFIAKETSAYWILFSIFLSLLSFVSAIVLGIWLFRPMNFEYDDPKVIVDNYRGKGKSLRFFVNKWASTWCDTANKNARIVNSKEKGLNCMLTLVVIGLAILTVSFLFLAISQLK